VWNAGRSLATSPAHCRERKVPVLQLTVKHSQCCQPFLAEGFGAGHAFNSRGVKQNLQSTWSAFFFQSLAFNPTNLSSKYHTNLWHKIRQRVGPAAFNCLLIFAELLFFKLLLQLLNFPPQHYQLSGIVFGFF